MTDCEIANDRSLSPEMVNSYENHTYERTYGPSHDLRRRHDDAWWPRAGGHRDRNH
ncbi:hypothetical protein EMIT0111MI5_20159 [Burkholderia sp. IT-111MI5]